MTSLYSNRPPLLKALLQSFLIIPFGDAQILIQMLARNHPALRRRLTGFGGALLVASIGWWALHWLFPGDCCRVSTILFPGEPVSSIIWSRLMPTIGLLFFIPLGGLIITGLLVGMSVLSQRLSSAGGLQTGFNLFRWLATGVMASPLGHIGVLTVLLGVRLGLLPASAGGSILGLIVPGLSVALLPALVAARRVERNLLDPLARPDQAIVLAAAIFYKQTSWLVGGLALAEAVFGVDGLGKLLVDALRVSDGALLLPLLLLFLAATALCRLHIICLETICPALMTDTLPLSLAANSSQWLKWVTLVLVLVIPLVFSLGASAPPPPEPAIVYAVPSASPWGTDGLGRNVLALGQLATSYGWLIALSGGLVSVGLGGLWASGIVWLCHNGHRALADAMRAPAEAIILLAPAPLTLWFFLHLYGFSVPPIIASGVIAGVVLIPRMVWGITGGEPGTLHPVNLLKRVGSHLAAAGFSTLQVSLMAALITGPSVLGWTTPGGLLAAYQDMISGASLLHGGPYLRIALSLALPGLALAYGWYLLADALTEPRNGNILADLLS